MRIPTESEIKRVSERISKEMQREVANLSSPTDAQIKRISEKYARRMQREMESLMR